MYSPHKAGICASAYMHMDVHNNRIHSVVYIEPFQLHKTEQKKLFLYTTEPYIVTHHDPHAIQLTALINFTSTMLCKRSKTQEYLHEELIYVIHRNKPSKLKYTMFKG